jgi:hypothetical protein
MPFFSHYKIQMPDIFPISEWEAFHAFGLNLCPGTSDAAGEFVRALGASAFRLRSADEALASITAGWDAAAGTIAFEAHYAQQRDLFSYFACLQSSVESALYACYIVLAHRHPSAIPWADLKPRKRQLEKELPKKLAQVYPTGSPLQATVIALAVSPQWAEIDAFRNLLIHRALPSRLVEGVIGDGPAFKALVVKYAASWSTPELRADESQLRERAVWIAERLRQIFADGLRL